MNALHAPVLAVALVAALVAPPAAAQDRASLRVCLDPAASSRGAAEACRRALDRGGLTVREQSAAWTNLGAALTELDRDGDALTAFDRAVAADPAFAPARINRALVRARRGMEDAALADWTEAIRLAPADWEARQGRAGLLLRLGRPEAALADLEAALNRAPREADLHVNRGIALAALGRIGQARAAFDRAVTLAPDDPVPWLERGRLRAEADPQGALSDFTEALRRDPAWAAVHVDRGRLLERLGRTEAALSDYRRAFELGLQDPWLNARIEALRN